MSRQSKIGALLLALAASLIYSLPQLLYFADGRPDALIQTMDEAPYVARVQEVLDGHWRVSDQYLWETKASPSVLPNHVELVLGGIGRAGGLTAETTLIAVRLIAPACLALAVIWLAFLLTQSAGWAAAAAALVLLEPGTYYYKPFQYLTSLAFGAPEPGQLELLYTRFHNPLVLAIPFVLAAGAVYRALVTKTRRDICVAGLLVGLNFYTQVFYWSYLYAGMFLLALSDHRDGERLRILAGVGLLGLICGGYALVEQTLRVQAMQGQDLLTRGWLLVRTHDPIYLLPKALLLGGLAFAFTGRPRDLAYRYLLSFLVGGYLLLNQNVITGREIQNYHFNYANAIAFAVAMVLLAQRWWSAVAPRFQARWSRAGGFALALLAIWLAGNAAVLQAGSFGRRMRAATVDEGAYPSNLKAKFRGTLDWIRDETPVDAVFLADPEVSFVLPIYTSGNVFLDPLQRDHVASFISEPELFERWMIHLTLQGLGPDELLAEVGYRPSMPFLGWGFGRNERLLAKYDFSITESFAQALATNELPQDYVREFEAFDAGHIATKLLRYRLDYLVVRDAAPRFRDNSLSRLREWTMRPVARIVDEGVTIYRIEARGD